MSWDTTHQSGCKSINQLCAFLLYPNSSALRLFKSYVGWSLNWLGKAFVLSFRNVNNGWPFPSTSDLVVLVDGPNRTARMPIVIFRMIFVIVISIIEVYLQYTFSSIQATCWSTYVDQSVHPVHPDISNISLFSIARCTMGNDEKKHLSRRLQISLTN